MSERVQKFLARSGYGSRRQIEKWLVEGRIRSDEGIYSLGDKVVLNDIVILDDQRIRVTSSDAPTRVIAYHKKEGEICTHSDPANRPTILESIPSITEGRWATVGRLDLNTTGLILISNDGDLVHGLMHPSSQIEREYLCRVLGETSSKTLQKLRNGVQSNGEFLRFDHIEFVSGKGANQWYRIRLTRGKNREIRRAWEAVGHRVSRLKRIRYGPIHLRKNLKQGEWAELDQNQIAILKAIANPNPQL